MAQQQPSLILVAEGSQPLRAGLVRRLGERGDRVAAAGDGERALELVALERPDVVLLDHELPGSTAWRCSIGYAPTTSSRRCR
jgi:CheY-like chemotaxis protein